VAEYGYDFEGRRISRTVYGSPNVTTKYCYDGEQVVAEYSGSTLVKKFVYGPGIDEPICMIAVAGESETVYYYHFDGLGSVAALSDVNSVIVERYSYDVFGEPNTTSSIGNPYLFTGRRYDDEVSMYYYRARYYKPGIGRFLQTDPIGYAGGLNLYTYCGNDPINWIDPLGLHIMNILPMMRVPSIMWALGNQGEKCKKKALKQLIKRYKAHMWNLKANQFFGYMHCHEYAEAILKMGLDNKYYECVRIFDGQWFLGPILGGGGHTFVGVYDSATGELVAILDPWVPGGKPWGNSYSFKWVWYPPFRKAGFRRPIYPPGL